mmetsp:Transcript_50797/g.148014  ORF Transcript_50797/g.148014 Transcript_50797/m.148014 type:complete len:264 (-) Transcript_50797:883-1674(-)
MAAACRCKFDKIRNSVLAVLEFIAKRISCWLRTTCSRAVVKFCAWSRLASRVTTAFANVAARWASASVLCATALFKPVIISSVPVSNVDNAFTVSWVFFCKSATRACSCFTCSKALSACCNASLLVLMALEATVLVSFAFKAAEAAIDCASSAVAQALATSRCAFLTPSFAWLTSFMASWLSRSAFSAAGCAICAASTAARDFIIALTASLVADSALPCADFAASAAAALLANDCLASPSKRFCSAEDFLTSLVSSCVTSSVL